MSRTIFASFPQTTSPAGSAKGNFLQLPADGIPSRFSEGQFSSASSRRHPQQVQRRAIFFSFQQTASPAGSAKGNFLQLPANGIPS
ncbi:MAG: hypothetical protein VZQ80_08555, partial [Lachnospiraceae bacterium]|nr:hypothetical protein [Lachnospiraceae bacterium]